jgi:hypothetical protein
MVVPRDKLLLVPGLLLVTICLQDLLTSKLSQNSNINTTNHSRQRRLGQVRAHM